MYALYICLWLRYFFTQCNVELISNNCQIQENIFFDPLSYAIWCDLAVITPSGRVILWTTISCLELLPFFQVVFLFVCIFLFVFVLCFFGGGLFPSFMVAHGFVIFKHRTARLHSVSLYYELYRLILNYI